ncbi:MAG TPA: hypothetical protein VMJ31_03510, partial [Methylocystis sp.]|nr:hypothetical protein [Methylocystis sp.]
MNRATFFRILFRILGFASLAFAVVSIYRGELRIDDQGDFVVGGTGGVVITSAHDPETFWRTITITIGLGCFFFLVSFARAGGSLTSPFAPTEGSLTSSLSAEERPELPNYDSDLCGKVVKGAACVCVGLIIAELLVLLLVHPSDDRCPGWIVHPNQPSA